MEPRASRQTPQKLTWFDFLWTTPTHHLMMSTNSDHSATELCIGTMQKSRFVHETIGFDVPSSGCKDMMTARYVHKSAMIENPNTINPMQKWEARGGNYLTPHQASSSLMHSLRVWRYKNTSDVDYTSVRRMWHIVIQCDQSDHGVWLTVYASCKHKVNEIQHNILRIE